MLLKDKVAIISGIGPGLGQELAYVAARQGARVVLAARSLNKLEEVHDQITAHGGEALVAPTDITDPAACRALVEQTLDHYGQLDVLVNSAYRPGNFVPAQEADLDDWRATMETNLFGTMNLTQAVVGPMQARGAGAIVMVNSMIIKKPLPTQAGYAASKGALAAATRVLATELGPSGIRVNSVFMGWMWGPPVQAWVRMGAEARGVPEQAMIDEVAEQIPLGHIPDDEDCANAAIFLASDMARVITGASLDVNGGEFMP